MPSRGSQELRFTPGMFHSPSPALQRGHLQRQLGGERGVISSSFLSVFAVFIMVGALFGSEQKNCGLWVGLCIPRTLLACPTEGLTPAVSPQQGYKPSLRPFLLPANPDKSSFLVPSPLSSTTSGQKEGGAKGNVWKHSLTVFNHFGICVKAK